MYGLNSAQIAAEYEEANEGEIVGAQLEGVEKEEVDRGDRLIVYEE